MFVKMVDTLCPARPTAPIAIERDERHEQRVLEQVLAFFVRATDFTRFSSIDMKSSPEENAPPFCGANLRQRRM